MTSMEYDVRKTPSRTYFRTLLYGTRRCRQQGGALEQDDLEAQSRTYLRTAASPPGEGGGQQGPGSLALQKWWVWPSQQNLSMFGIGITAFIKYLGAHCDRSTPYMLLF